MLTSNCNIASGYRLLRRRDWYIASGYSWFSLLITSPGMYHSGIGGGGFMLGNSKHSLASLLIMTPTY